MAVRGIHAGAAAAATYHDWENNLLMLRYDAEVLVHDNTQR